MSDRVKDPSRAQFVRRHGPIFEHMSRLGLTTNHGGERWSSIRVSSSESFPTVFHGDYLIAAVGAVFPTPSWEALFVTLPSLPSCRRQMKDQIGEHSISFASLLKVPCEAVEQSEDQLAGVVVVEDSDRTGKASSLVCQALDNLRLRFVSTDRAVTELCGR